MRLRSLRRLRRFARADIRAGQEPHRLAERDALLARNPLEFRIAVERRLSGLSAMNCSNAPMINCPCNPGGGQRTSFPASEPRHERPFAKALAITLASNRILGS